MGRLYQSPSPIADSSSSFKKPLQHLNTEASSSAEATTTVESFSTAATTNPLLSFTSAHSATSVAVFSSSKIFVVFTDSFFMHQIGENSISKLEWKSSPDPFLFGSFELVQVQHQSPMAVSAPSNDVAPTLNENQNQEGGEQIRFLKDECSPPCVLRPFDVMPERIEQKMVDSLPALMASRSPPLNALVVPSEDYHRSEYVSDRDKRREFIFTAPDEVAWLYNIREAVDSMLVKDDFGSAGCHVIVEEYLEGEKGDSRVGFTHGVMNMDDMSNLGLTILASGAAAWVIVLSVTYAYTWDNPPGFAQTIQNWFGKNSRSASMFIKAVVGVFGLAQLLDHADSHVTTIVCGTVAHIESNNSLLINDKMQLAQSAEGCGYIEASVKKLSLVSISSVDSDHISPFTSLLTICGQTAPSTLEDVSTGAPLPPGQRKGKHSSTAGSLQEYVEGCGLGVEAPKKHPMTPISLRIAALEALEAVITMVGTVAGTLKSATADGGAFYNSQKIQAK
ncbi:Creatinase/Aminopeptidase P/Spt16, N-terminal [Sesbania bispinosa]|nr:Creatinase/Aminopeptidase P/Spt16, N-terminal [Sesbania bispinosa]